MADTVARAGEDDAVLRGEGLEEPVVVGALEPRLEHAVVDVRDGELVADARKPERLELEVGERPRRVLRQGLIDPQGDLGSRAGLA